MEVEERHRLALLAEPGGDRGEVDIIVGLTTVGYIYYHRDQLLTG